MSRFKILTGIIRGLISAIFREFSKGDYSHLQHTAAIFMNDVLIWVMIFLVCVPVCTHVYRYICNSIQNSEPEVCYSGFCKKKKKTEIMEALIKQLQHNQISELDIVWILCIFFNEFIHSRYTLCHYISYLFIKRHISVAIQAKQKRVIGKTLQAKIYVFLNC